ncbi:MAG: hypothetical protein RDA78_16095 [Roseibium sp.]|uniref:hypothetical protein n=1 Tax=Roseibium sp. TaxID=1936156 RepID=UPI003D9C6580
MDYLAIVSVENNRVTKFMDFDNQADADAHVAAQGGFSFHNDQGWLIADLYIDGQTATESPPAGTVEGVKAAASRLILSLAPDWQQRNYIARGSELIRKVQTGGTLTPEEEAEETAMQALWTTVKAIRAKSDELEAISPIPADYAAQLEAVAST